MGIVLLGAVAGLLAGGVIVSVRDSRRYRIARALMDRIEQTDSPLACLDTYRTRFQVVEINVQRSRWQPYVVAITPAQIAIYPVYQEEVPPLVFPLAGLRWFGRPKKYSNGANEIWLHFEQDGHWFLLKMNLFQNRMQTFIRALKTVAIEEQVTAYRRQRPYIHHGPSLAQPASQDMQGAWTLGPSVHLYLTPLFLVVLDGPAVKRTIPLNQIQKVAAIKRLDQPHMAGLVRCEVSGEPLAFALHDHESFAKALAEAARRTLEDPVEWQRKKKKNEWAADDDFDEAD